jgi:hypothetical protein
MLQMEGDLMGTKRDFFTTLYHLQLHHYKPSLIQRYQTIRYP